MFKQHFANMDLTALPLFALGVFLTFFVLMLLRTFVGKTQQDYEAVAAQPLHDGTPISSQENSP